MSLPKWRHGVGGWARRWTSSYLEPLPLGSSFSSGNFPGADLVVGGGLESGVAFGMTAGFYQYTHVRDCRQALTAILASVDSFVRRMSQSQRRNDDGFTDRPALVA